MVLTTIRSMKNYGLQRKMPVFFGPRDIFSSSMMIARSSDADPNIKQSWQNTSTTNIITVMSIHYQPRLSIAEMLSEWDEREKSILPFHKPVRFLLFPSSQLTAKIAEKMQEKKKLKDSKTSLK